MNKNFLKVKDSYIYTVVGLFGLLLAFVLIPMEVQTGEPRLFPYIYATGLILVSVFKLITLLFYKKNEHFNFNKRIMKYVGINILIYAVYIFSIQHIGFFIMSILFIIVLLRVLGEGWKLSIALSIVLPVFIYLLFTQILALYFPSGILF